MANGKKGWQATVARYGQLFAGQVLAKWRRDHPSQLERTVIAWLDDFQVTYQREVQIGDDRSVAFADFVLVDLNPVGAKLRYKLSQKDMRDLNRLNP